MTTTSRSTFRLLVLVLVSIHACAFVPPTGPSLSNTQLFLAKKKGKRSGKGFGEAPAAPQNQSAKQETFVPMSTKPEPKPMEGIPAEPNTDFQIESDRTVERPGANSINQGQVALEAMRREREEKKDAELRRVKEIRETDKLLQESAGASAIPEKVAMRMGKRMLPFVGIPLFGSMGAFVAFWYFATYKDMEFQPGAVAVTTTVLLLSGLLGITYSIVSASWDEDREGSLLGIEEFQKNVGNIKEGLDRSKENLLLREKMAGLPEAEIEAAIADLERREKRQNQSFQSKMEELEK